MEREAILASYEHGPAAVVALVEGLLARHQAELAALAARVQALEDRLAKDSHNSHPPPARELPPKPQPTSLRGPSGWT